MMNEHTVFVRTEAGQQVVRDPNSELPRSVRTLLFSIDGRSTARSYAELLPNFGNVYALLDFLHQAGYIDEVKVRRRRPSAQVADSVLAAPQSGASSQFEPSRQQQPQASQQDSIWAVSQQPQPALRAAPSATPSPVGVGSLLRGLFSRKPRALDSLPDWQSSPQFAPSSQQGPATQPIEGTAAPAHGFDNGQDAASSASLAALDALAAGPELTAPLSEQARLQAARDLMMDFLHLYLPAIAQEASMSIQAQHTYEQLLASLPDYSQLVLRTGDAGAAHLAQLHLTLGLTQG